MPARPRSSWLLREAIMEPPISSPQLTERVYTLEKDKNQPWAFLKVKSRGTKHTSFPQFIQGEPIAGTVELSLEKTDHIQAVTVEVQGVAFAVGQEPLQFLKKEITLWSTSMGDPRTGNTGIGSSKLKGDYVWPFSIALPDTVATSAVKRGPLSVYPLPPSFSARADGTSLCYLEYKVVATIRRGRLRVDHSLSTTITYLPRSRPAAPSVLRQLAYREETALPGPGGDPEGWEIKGPQSVTGVGQVKVTGLFALAKPLCYTRGTSIPFWVTLSCSDIHALDLSGGRVPVSIHLVRVLSMGPDATDEQILPGKDVFEEQVGKGICWPSEDDNDRSETRELVGEIPLADSLMPSFVFPRVTIRYRVGLTVMVPGCIATALPEVEIATDLASGPTPRSRVPETHREHQEIIR
ncbi:hypothetical protein JB92DRAFT_2884404 [Gautieria morchelliformis]|nr:hypothetical protein JB92DRAFT_2884404 [Gautieria morchelliformis]